jgi:hypothetical protein
MKRGADDAVADVGTYRRLALALPGAVEGSHMSVPDFRINGRIFATLAYGHKGLCTLKLTPEQQAMFVADAPESVLAGALSAAFQAAKKKA